MPNYHCRSWNSTIVVCFLFFHHDYISRNSSVITVGSLNATTNSNMSYKLRSRLIKCVHLSRFWGLVMVLALQSTQSWEKHYPILLSYPKSERVSLKVWSRHQVTLSAPISYHVSTNMGSISLWEPWLTWLFILRCRKTCDLKEHFHQSNIFSRAVKAYTMSKIIFIICLTFSICLS